VPEETVNEVHGQFDPILKTVTIEKLHNFLDFAEVSAKCQSCGGNSLSPLRSQVKRADGEGFIASETEPAFMALTIQSDLESGYQIQVPGFVITCRRCGFTQNMSAVPLIAWMRDLDNEG
jgi:hypothetical protein